MQRSQDEAKRKPTQGAALANQYRAIGPAAIVAALLCKSDTKKVVSPVSKAA